MKLSVPGVTISFDKTPQGRFLNYNLMKEDSTLGYDGNGGTIGKLERCDEVLPKNAQDEEE